MKRLSSIKKSIINGNSANLKQCIICMDDIDATEFQFVTQCADSFCK